MWVNTKQDTFLTYTTHVICGRSLNLKETRPYLVMVSNTCRYHLGSMYVPTQFCYLIKQLQNEGVLKQCIANLHFFSINYKYNRQENPTTKSKNVL